MIMIGSLEGLLNVAERVRRLWRKRRPHGDRGTVWQVLSSEDVESGIQVRYLIAGDPMHAIKGLLSAKGAQARSLESIGGYFKLTVLYPPGTSLRFWVVPAA